MVTLLVVRVRLSGLRSRRESKAVFADLTCEDYSPYSLTSQGRGAKSEERHPAAPELPASLCGQGSALAMVVAYVLAGELHLANGDYFKAFGRYQDIFGPFVFSKQKVALFLCNQIFRLMAIPWIADLAIGRDLADNITLSNYSLRTRSWLARGLSSTLH
jgi:hypothetical protein